MEENVLTISAERPTPSKGEGVESVIAERTFGTFTRQVVLGKTLDSERIEASYEGGVLTVAIPVAEQAKPRRIEVSVGSGHKPVSHVSRLTALCPRDRLIPRGQFLPGFRQRASKASCPHLLRVTAAMGF